MSKDFRMDDLVELHDCAEMSGRKGRIKGIATDLAEFKMYIIELMTPLPNGFTNIVMTEHCIKHL